MTLPNFFVIGAAKSGTTSLYSYLGQHPEVYISPIKEPHFFFALEGEQPDFRGPGDRELLSRAVTGIEEYRALFAGVTDEKAVGEASPGYLYSPEAAGRIRRRVPKARLIAILRHPADRAYSAYLHLVRDGLEPLGFSEALEEEEARVRDGWSPTWQYRRMGFYHGQLERYYDLFGRQQVGVYLYEELSEDPVGLVQDIFRFLGVDDAFVPDVSHRRNVSSTIRKSNALVSVVTKPNPLKTVARAVLPAKLRKRISANLLHRNLGKAPPMPEEVRKKLVEVYREDVKKLGGLIGRDLSGWLKE
jgi:hypothetical protein